ncbi:3638_t:CDS:2 [Paraglomus brasilianum]|uniref:3638_t:CDS:1 n=1 Tax=Paraglomus brasilianum TaxID=144538 RepID=A0A9N9C5D3_9GLOM|nr:3638_t:CDS:2 [Paraglomus brasilianum]
MCSGGRPVIQRAVGHVLAQYRQIRANSQPSSAVLLLQDAGDIWRLPTSVGVSSVSSSGYGQLMRIPHQHMDINNKQLSAKNTSWLVILLAVL